MFVNLPCPISCMNFATLVLSNYVVMFWVHPEFYLNCIAVCFEFFPDDGEKNIKLTKLSCYELFAIFIGPLLAGMPVLHVLIFLVIPDGTNFLYYNVPESLKTPVVF
ncbi:unnamed protein product, partial [Allacma fusca]